MISEILHSWLYYTVNHLLFFKTLKLCYSCNTRSPLSLTIPFSLLRASMCSDYCIWKLKKKRMAICGTGTVTFCSVPGKCLRFGVIAKVFQPANRRRTHGPRWRNFLTSTEKIRKGPLHVFLFYTNWKIPRNWFFEFATSLVIYVNILFERELWILWKNNISLEHFKNVTLKKF